MISGAVELKILHNGKWSTTYEVIFEHEGKHYRTVYDRKVFDDSILPYHYEADMINCVEMEKKKVLVEQWVPVEDNEDA